MILSAGPITLASTIHKKIRIYRIGFPFAMSLLAGLFFGIIILAVSSGGDYQLVKALSSHVASLVEIQDRAELQRLVSSMKEDRDADFLIVQDGSVLASSRSLTELDLPYTPSKAILKLFESEATLSSLVTHVPATRSGGPATKAEIIMLSPLKPIVIEGLAIWFFITMLGIIFSHIYSQQMTFVLDKTLKPLEKLDDAIRSLKNIEDVKSLAPTNIVELENIRTAISETHFQLLNARDALAQERAIKLTDKAYQRLVHDLYHPVAALGDMARISNDSTIPDESRRKAIVELPGLAEDVIQQIEAAKNNLQFDPKVFKEEDILPSIREGAHIAKYGSGKKNPLNVAYDLPSESIIVPHDAFAFKRVIMNLVSNAIAACKGNVEISLRRQETYTSIFISDDGPGLTFDEASRHLQGQGKSQNGDRTAFGLSTANHIVRSHGGKIIYKRSSWGGACFEVRI